MKRSFAWLLLSILAGFTDAVCAQSTDPSMHMSHPAAQQADNPAEQITTGPPVPDLLADAAHRPAVQLNQFEHWALTANPTLAQSQALVQQSAAQARQAGLYPNPSVGYQGEQMRGGDYGGGEQGAFIQQTIVLGGKLGLRKEVYNRQRQGDQIGVAEQRYRILSDVDQSFYAALAAQEIVNTRRRLLALSMDALETAHQLANVGQADAPDVLQAEVEAEQAKIDYLSAQRAFIQQFRGLAALAGKPDLPPSPVGGSLEDPPSIDQDQIVERIVRESPSVRHAQQDVLRARAELASAKREPIPDIQLRAGVEQNFERLTESSPRTVGAQAFATAGVTLPLFNRNQGNIAAARADLARAEAEVNRQQLSLRRMTEPLLQAYLSGQLEAERYKNQMIPRALQAYRLYLQKYRQMGAAYPQVLISQRTYFQLQIGYINALQQVWSNAVALQHYTLSDGLAPPVPSGTTSTTLNLPGAGGSGAQ